MSKKQNISCDIMVANIESNWSGGELQLLANCTYTLIIDYPFAKEGRFPINTTKRGMGLIGLMPHIYKAYIKQYQAAEKDPANCYWHGIGDLAIEGIRVDHQKMTIRLDVRS
jgi:hypothetical protein